MGNSRGIYICKIVIITILHSLAFISCASYKGHTTSGKQKTINKQPKDNVVKTISTVEDWKQTLQSAMDKYAPMLTLTINNYDTAFYSLDSIGYEEVTIMSDGLIQEKNGTNVADITYKFKYDSNNKIISSLSNSKVIENLSQDEQQALTKAKEIIAKIIKPDMTEYERELAIHDYMVANFRYDIGGVYETKNVAYKDPAYLITGLLLNKKGRCEAYAKTFLLLGKLASLDIRIATGLFKAEGSNKNWDTHSWNIIKLDGEYYHVDVTSDDPIPNVEGRVIHDFFNLNDDDLYSTHIYNPKKNGDITCTSIKYNYYKYNNIYLQSKSEIEALFKKSISEGKKIITFYAKGVSIKDAEELSNYIDANKISSYTTSNDFGKEGLYKIELTYR